MQVFNYNVAQISFPNRETLLGQLTVHQKSIQEQFSQACNGKVPKGKNLPEFVNLIVFVRQLEAKVCFHFFVLDVINKNSFNIIF